MMIVYTFKNKINNKYYVGQTCRTFEERTKEHLRHNKTAFDKALKNTVLRILITLSLMKRMTWTNLIKKKFSG